MVLFGKTNLFLLCLLVWNSCSSMFWHSQGAKDSEIIALLNCSKCCSWSAWVRLLLCFCRGHCCSHPKDQRLPAEGLIPHASPCGKCSLVDFLASTPSGHLLLLLPDQAFLHLLLPVNLAWIKALHSDLLILSWCGFTGCSFFTFPFLLIVILLCALQFFSDELWFQK